MVGEIVPKSVLTRRSGSSTMFVVLLSCVWPPVGISGTGRGLRPRYPKEASMDIKEFFNLLNENPKYIDRLLDRLSDVGDRRGRRYVVLEWIRQTMIDEWCESTDTLYSSEVWK